MQVIKNMKATKYSNSKPIQRTKNNSWKHIIMID